MSDVVIFLSSHKIDVVPSTEAPETTVIPPTQGPLCIEAPLELHVRNEDVRGYEKCALNLPENKVLVSNELGQIPYGLCCPNSCTKV